ncbi:Uncharacterised protein [Dermatophilus congolensis]|uniref:Uncharacterized protein n=1 Tax=Dermatophilus congolensis TaxID=1863 RepID=A0AA46H0Z2_9MICO|nr:Uncharacterised protein [Dermatophilus congolensis]
MFLWVAVRIVFIPERVSHTVGLSIASARICALVAVAL